MARLAGRVQGVVVQITTDAPTSDAAPDCAPVSWVTGNLTQTVGEVCS